MQELIFIIFALFFLGICIAASGYNGSDTYPNDAQVFALGKELSQEDKLEATETYKKWISHLLKTQSLSDGCINFKNVKLPEIQDKTFDHGMASFFNNRELDSNFSFKSFIHFDIAMRRNGLYIKEIDIERQSGLSHCLGDNLFLSIKKSDVEKFLT